MGILPGNYAAYLLRTHGLTENPYKSDGDVSDFAYSECYGRCLDPPRSPSSSLDVLEICGGVRDVFRVPTDSLIERKNYVLFDKPKYVYVRVVQPI